MESILVRIGENRLYSFRYIYPVHRYVLRPLIHLRLEDPLQIQRSKDEMDHILRQMRLLRRKDQSLLFYT